MLNQLSLSVYQKLLSEITSLYRGAQQRSKAAINTILTETYWQIGKRIVVVEQKNQLHAEYGNRLIERLSDDLKKDFGQGFSLRNLAYMRQFYIAFPILQTSAKLPWSHYQALSAIKESRERQHYERQAIRNNWSARELNRVLRKDKVIRLRFKEPKERFIEPEHVQLKVKRGIPYTYRIIRSDVIDPNKRTLLIDCGFNVRRQLPESGGRLRENDIICTQYKNGEYSIEKTGERRLSAVAKDASTLAKAEATSGGLYTFKAAVERVIDGDTIWCEIDCGFGIWIRQKLRLKSIDAPELSAKKGQQAKDFVQKTLRRCDFIAVKTYTSDKYDRYLADIFYLPQEHDPEIIAKEGLFLNQELLDEGLARVF